ncbi:hypothetical protein PHJA_000847100 [Phtheirospermum japonicum]|uniref:DUF674 domain-containing protein n=1 Tax=Phtheirospermum japonicum TaxID=374723 RepID=A0A830BSN0_9LAMI|nr:hypothetical protein PHJA_000847100 [Phtheirospermum japonicum]
MANSSVSLKLLIDTQAKRVIFAEADKEFVDFLFYILSLPVAKLVSLLGKDGMVGSLANLYESIENLNESYIEPNQTRDSLLKHVSSVTTGSCVPLLAIKNAPATAKTKKFYRCNCTNNQYSHFVQQDDPRAVCPNCGKYMDKLLEYVKYAPAAVDEQVSINKCGFVKEVVTYMVMDDLTVKPMSTISSITLLNELGVEDVRALQEKIVNLGMTEAVKLLKASLESKNVLTHVFLSGDN